MNLVKYEQNGLELWVDESTGLAYAHMKAIHRMLGGRLSGSSLNRRLALLPKDIVKVAKIQTSKGLHSCKLYPVSVVFDLALELKPELAAQLAGVGLVYPGKCSDMSTQTIDKKLKVRKQQSVYILQCSQTGVVKIGLSHNPKQRLSAIQTSYPFLLKLERIINTDEPRLMERQLHRALDDFRLKGEWFDGACLQMIAS